MSDFYKEYYGDLIGATILSFEGMRDDEFGGSPFPTFKIKFKNGEIGEIQISQDEEGNGGGFVFGLAVPAVTK